MSKLRITSETDGLRARWRSFGKTDLQVRFNAHWAGPDRRPTRYSRCAPAQSVPCENGR